jgi:phosphoglucomutase
MVHPLAGKPVPSDRLVDPSALVAAYRRMPDFADPLQRVAFGTSGHRGSALSGSFNEAHILAIVQAICDYRVERGITGPLYLGKDTHALSGPAQDTALEVLAANGVEVRIQRDGGFTPTPVISRAILEHNRLGESRADGVVITPSHNPPEDGGIKYNPPNGGPADTDVTAWMEDRANSLLGGGNGGVRRLAADAARHSGFVWEEDFVASYVDDLEAVIDMEAIRHAGLRIGVDPMGGAAVGYWGVIADRYGLDLEVVNPQIDPSFSFMPADHDGRIRMDCSSPWSMAGLVGLKDRFDIAWGNDADVDRHGIVTPSAGLLNPNHFLAVAVRYLLTHRPRWRTDAVVGKTLVSSGMLDRVAAGLGRRIFEVPVGFKWFSSGLLDGGLCFGGEESAGASFLCHDGSVWTTDKDGIILGLLAAEITAVTGADPGEHYRRLTEAFGVSHYVRIDAPASALEKAAFRKLSPGSITATTLAGEEIRACQTRAPGNGAPIGGIKVITDSGWFAARPSGTENLYKLYAESFGSDEHLQAIVADARRLLAEALAS